MECFSHYCKFRFKELIVYSVYGIHCITIFILTGSGKISRLGTSLPPTKYPATTHWIPLILLRAGMWHLDGANYNVVFRRLLSKVLATLDTARCSVFWWKSVLYIIVWVIIYNENNYFLSVEQTPYYFLLA